MRAASARRRRAITLLKLMWRWIVIMSIAFSLIPNTDQNPFGNRSAIFSLRTRSLENLTIPDNLPLNEVVYHDYEGQNCIDNLPSNEVVSHEYEGQNCSDNLVSHDYEDQNCSDNLSSNVEFSHDYEGQNCSDHLSSNDESCLDYEGQNCSDHLSSNDESCLDYEGQNCSDNLVSHDHEGQNCSDNLSSNVEFSHDYEGQNCSDNLVSHDYEGQNCSGNLVSHDYEGQNCSGNLVSHDYEGQNCSGNLVSHDYEGQNCCDNRPSNDDLSNGSQRLCNDLRSTDKVLLGSECTSCSDKLSQNAEVSLHSECRGCVDNTVPKVSFESESQTRNCNRTQNKDDSFYSEFKEMKAPLNTNDSRNKTMKRFMNPNRDSNTDLQATDDLNPLGSPLFGNSSSEFDSSRLVNPVNNSEYRTSIRLGKTRKSVGLDSALDSGSTPDKHSEPKINSMKKAVVSCRGRCGLDVHVPCSCVQICFIYGNCCYDMSEECPHLVMSERSRLRHLLQADIECSELTDTFMVMSCSAFPLFKSDDVNKDLVLNEVTTNDRNMEDVTLSPDSEDTTVPVRNFLEDPSMSDNPFLSALFDAPVADLGTGLVYRNRSLALCNGAQASDIITWKPLFTLLNLKKPRNLMDLYTIADKRSLKYTLPDIPKGYSVGSPCKRDAIRSCKPEWLVGEPELEGDCLNGSITYYTVDRNLKSSLYANIHCVICNLGSDKRSVPLMRHFTLDRNAGFSVTMSFTGNNRIKLSAQTPLYVTSWRSVNCSLATSEQGNLLCHSGCDKDSEKLPDGTCLPFTQVKFAVATGNCLFTVSQSMEKELLRLVTCHLETHGNAVLDVEDVRFETVYDTGIGIPLLQMSLAVKYPLSFSFEEKVQIWRELALLLHDADFCCEKAVPANVSCKAYTCLVGDLEVPKVKSTSALPLNGSPVLTEQEKRSKGSWSIFCEFPVQLRSQYTSLDFICLKVKVNDSHLDFFHRAAQVSCLGDKVLHRRARQACSSTGLRLRGAVFTICSLILLSLH